jgi:endoglucanase Acf2
MADVSGDTSECVAAIITILRSEFQVNAVYDRSAGRPNVTFTVSGEQYRVYIADRFEEQYTAAPQAGDLILSALPDKLRASSTGTRSVLVSRSGITLLPSSYTF